VYYSLSTVVVNVIVIHTDTNGNAYTDTVTHTLLVLTIIIFAR